jgi:hypothetical protein
MTIEIIIPENGKIKKTKDMVFSILIDYPNLTLTQLQRKIKSLYGVNITLQSILKSINYFSDNNVILKENKFYSINKDWIYDVKNYFDNLYFDTLKVENINKKINYSKNVSIYTLNNLFELDKLWSDYLINWIKNEKKDKRNVWQGNHCWWLIPRIQNEELLHDQFDKFKVKTYNLIGRDTLLDRVAYNYYKSRKENVKILKKPILEDISCFGEFVFKYKIPDSIFKKLEKIYYSTKKTDKLDINTINNVFKQNEKIEVMIIKDVFLANNIKYEIIKYFK